MRQKTQLFAVLSLVGILSTPLFALLAAPTNFIVTVGEDDVFFDWDDVEDATKYSVDVCVEVTYATETGEETIPVEMSFGTSDRDDGGDMADSDLLVPQETIIAGVFAALADMGIDTSTISDLTLQATAKVKALNPGKGKGPQNNPFSDEAEFELTWSAL